MEVDHVFGRATLAMSHLNCHAVLQWFEISSSAGTECQFWRGRYVICNYAYWIVFLALRSANSLW